MNHSSCKYRRPKENDPRKAILEIVLLNFSTGVHHNLAAQPIIRVSETSANQGKCSIYLEIAGDNLALLVAYPMSIYLQGQDLYVYDWKKGKLKAVRIICIPFFKIPHL